MGRRHELVMALTLAVPACREHFDVRGDGAPIVDVGDGRDGSLVTTGNESTSTCRPLLDGTGATLRFAAVDSLAAGARMFVWQVQDAGISTSGETIAVTNPGDAGNWEIVTIESIAGTDVTLAAPLAHTYSSAAGTPGRRAQACTMRQYERVSVPAGSVLTTVPWDGDSGGVIAMLVRETLDLSGTIDVGGAGFRGGAGVVIDTCSSTTELDPPACGGRKGEGLDGAAWGMLGRGNRANGGGGGNAFNAGGAGGGNGDAGGPGGIECCNMMPGTGGLPGSKVAIPIANRISFGGGGGQGHDNDNVVGAGGAGGGLVIMYAGVITGAGSIDASGRRGDSPASDGAGGGGAGGTIVVRANASTFTGMLRAPGGTGGDVTDGDTNPDVHGPGGGGGGGHVLGEGVTLATIVVLGGGNGVDALDPRGAGPGKEGQIER